MKTTTMNLLYVMDPLCGWCYGNSATIEQLFVSFNGSYGFEVIPGGMITGPNVRPQTASFRNYVLAADRRIASMTGMKFGASYEDSLNDTTLLLDSEPPSRALIAITSLKPGSGVYAASAIQRARFLEGKNLSDEESYRGVCETVNVGWDAFVRAFRSETIRKETQQAFVRAHALTSGFPTLLLDHGDSACTIAHGYAPYETVKAKLESLEAE